MLGNIGNLAQLLRQAKDVQHKLGEVQKKLAAMRVEASAGGGMVTVVANGHQEILSVKIDPAAVNADEVELLEELVLAAVNAAKKNLDYIRIRKGGACGPTLIGETVYLVNSHRKQKFKIKVKIRTESYQKDKVTEKWFIVGAKSELRIGCTVPQKGVKNVYTPTEANPVS